MPNYPLTLANHPSMPGVQVQPFTESQTAGAAAQNQLTLAAIPGRRYAITRLVFTAGPIAAVTGTITVSNIQKVAGTAGTVSYQFTEGTTTGGALILDFSQPLFCFAENTAVVITIPAIGSGSATAIEVSGFLI